MSSQSDAENSASGQPDDDESGGLLPAIIVGAGILVVAALLIFDFGGGDDGAKDAKQTAAAAQRGKKGAEGKGGKAGKGGVESRPYDAPQRPPGSKLNPKIRLPNLGMSPTAAPAPEEIPDFQSTAEEIAWYEKKLAGARKIRDDRQKYVERLPKVKQRIQEGPNPEAGMKSFAAGS